MQRFKCIRTGRKAGRENKDLACLYGSWELDEQLGIREDPRKRPEASLKIPEIVLAAPSTRAVVRPGE